MRRIFSGLVAAIVCFSVSAVFAQKPIPNGKDACTTAQFGKQIDAYSTGRMDLYEKHTKDSEANRKSVKDFAEKLLRRIRGEQNAPTWKQLDEQADKLLAAGESDPLVLVDIGMIKIKNRKKATAKKVLKNALELYAPTDYPASAKLTPCNLLQWIYNDTMHGPTWQPYNKDVPALIVGVMAQTADEPQNRRYAWDAIGPYLELQANNPGAFVVQTAIYDLYKKSEKVDPWIKLMVEGYRHCALGWQARGNGYANTVSQENFKIFHEQMIQAAEDFTKAWELEPKNPESATAMIDVAMAGGDEGHSPRDWFDRAVEGQMDYMPAYKLLIWSLRPRWGGSHRAMYQFGLDCLATKRFDTIVPEQFIQILIDIKEEVAQEGNIFDEGDIFDQVKTLIEGIENEPSRRDNAESGLHSVAFIQSTGFAIASIANRNDEARKLLDKVGDKLDHKVFPIFDRRYPYDVSRIYALTGKAAEDVEKFDELVADGAVRGADVRKTAQEVLAKAVAVDDDKNSKYFFDYWKNQLEALDKFEQGDWVDLAFEKRFLTWQPILGNWNVLDDGGVEGLCEKVHHQMGLKCSIPFPAPYEIEFDMGFTGDEPGITAGLMINNLWSLKRSGPIVLFGANPTDKKIFYSILNGKTDRQPYEVADQSKCRIALKFWNPKFELSADGQKHSVAELPKTPPSDTFLLMSLSQSKRQFHNVRIRKLSPEEPASEKK